MKPKLLIQLAAGCLLFFAIGHSIGHFTRHIVENPNAKEVLKAMTDNKFDMFGQMRSYDENYIGMSLNLIITLITIAILFWLLAKHTEVFPRLIIQLLVPFTLLILGFAITSFLYFFTMPGITCSIAVFLLIMAIKKLKEASN